jgi:hypothetical protein
VRNFVVGRDIVPIASQGGVNFYIGNNPEADGRTAIVPGTRWDWWGGYEDAIRLAEREKGRSLKPSEISNHYFAKGLGFVFGSPGQSLPLLARKLYMFWAGGERSNNKYIYFFWHQSGLGKVPLPGFWLIAPLGLAGGVLAWRRRRQLSLYYLFIISYMVGVVVFFVNARFRLPVVPVLIIFAAYAVFRLVSLARARGVPFFNAAALVVICVGAVNLDFLRFRENKIHEDSLSHYTLGNAYLKMEKPRSAINEYEKALDVYRRYPVSGFRLVERNVNFNLGRLYVARGLFSRAIPLLENVGGNDEYTVLALELLAHCYSNQSRHIEAFRIYSDIFRAAPNRPGVRNALTEAALAAARQQLQQENTAAARDILQRALAMVPGNSSLTRELESMQGAP